MQDTFPPQTSLFHLQLLLGIFQRRYQNISVTAVRVFLEIAIAHLGGNPKRKPPTVSHLSEILDIPQPTVTRLLKMLGGGDCKLQPSGGLRMVETISDIENGKPVKRCILSDEGQTILFEMNFHPL